MRSALQNPRDTKDTTGYDMEVLGKTNGTRYKKRRDKYQIQSERQTRRQSADDQTQKRSVPEENRIFSIPGSDSRLGERDKILLERSHFSPHNAEKHDGNPFPRM